MNLVIPEFVDLKTMATLFDSTPYRVREMIQFVQGLGYAVEVSRWGKNLRRVKYNYPQFKHALLEITAATMNH